MNLFQLLKKNKMQLNTLDLIFENDYLEIYFNYWRLKSSYIPVILFWRIKSSSFIGSSFTAVPCHNVNVFYCNLKLKEISYSSVNICVCANICYHFGITVAEKSFINADFKVTYSNQ